MPRLQEGARRVHGTGAGADPRAGRRADGQPVAGTRSVRRRCGEGPAHRRGDDRRGAGAHGSGMTPRRHLVVDLAGTSRNWALPREGAGRIETSVPEGWEVTIVKSAAPASGEAGSSGSPEAIAAVGNAEAYFGFGVTPELFTAAPNLRWIHSAAAGVGTSLFPALRESDVVFTNSAGVAA